MARSCLVLAVLLLACAPPARAAWYADTQAIMGTRVHAELWLDDAAADDAAADDAAAGTAAADRATEAERLLEGVMDEMRRIDAAFSPYREDSELSRLNRLAGAGWVDASDEMLDLLEKSHRASELTGGAFDITYASVGRYYDFREGRRPDAAQIDAAIAAIDYRHVVVDRAGRRVRFAHPGVYIDLGGIAKGYAVDRAIALLARAGITEAEVSAGGDSRILGDRRGDPWTVGVRDPRDRDKVVVLLPLVDTAVSTSGDYERFFDESGVRYHHILDPATGDSARKSLSVTILGPEATFTDALSTSVFVLGAEAGLALIDRLPGVDAIVIDAEGRLHYSAGLAELAGSPGSPSAPVP